MHFGVEGNPIERPACDQATMHDNVAAITDPASNPSRQSAVP